MKKIILILLLATGCSTLFNPDMYNPNPRPVVVEEEPKVDTLRITINGVETIILDTLKTDY